MAKASTKQETKRKSVAKKVGAPRTFDRRAVLKRVCAITSTSEKGIARILEDEPNMPSLESFWDWLDADTDEGRELVQLYREAKQRQQDYTAEILYEIADDSRNDWMEKVGKDGEVFKVIDHEHIARTKLRIDTRKWVMARLHPKKYSDTLKVGGSDDLPPMKTENETAVKHTFDDLRAVLAKVTGKA